MTRTALAAPKSSRWTPKPSVEEEEPAVEETEEESNVNEPDEEELEENVVADDSARDDATAPEVEEDEEVRIAVEMAIAAAQNPKMSPAELRKLVAEKNKQVAIVDEFEHKKQQAKQKEREEASRRWSEKKEMAFSWWQSKTDSLRKSADNLQMLAEQQAEALKDRAERRLYAEDIKNDKENQELRRKIKVLQKTLKAHRITGNRTETRHAFKRQKEEKRLVQLNDKTSKLEKAFISGGYNIHEYAKAMMRASRKWKKRGSDEELALEAQLCRNMHQMLALEKQKAKNKKSYREIKKYLQRCKGWLSDKKALCEMQLMTLDATNSSMLLLYEDTLKQQDALIAKLKASEEFKDVDLEEVELDNWKVLSERTINGPSATLSALRGLPINDSIRAIKEKEKMEEKLKAPPAAHHQNGGGPELYIETHDDHSVHSQLSDPDDADGNNQSLSDSDRFDFGSDAPWMAVDTSALGSVEEEDSKPAAKPIHTNGHTKPVSTDETSDDHADTTSSSEPVSETKDVGEADGHDFEVSAVDGPKQEVQLNGDGPSVEDNTSSSESSPNQGPIRPPSPMIPTGGSTAHSFQYSETSAHDPSETNSALAGDDIHLGENSHYLSDASATEHSPKPSPTDSMAWTVDTVPSFVSAGDEDDPARVSRDDFSLDHSDAEKR